MAFEHRFWIRRSGNGVETSGLFGALGFEIRAVVSHHELLDTAEHILIDLIEHFGDQLGEVPGSEFPVGLAILTLERGDDRCMEVYEFDLSKRAFVRGLNAASIRRVSQEQLCARFHAEYDPPAPSSLTAISPQLFTAQIVEGVRYGDMGADRSGWIITEHGFRGSVRELLLEHSIHIVERRPDLVEVLALPPGFHFLKDIGVLDIWFAD